MVSTMATIVLREKKKAKKARWHVGKNVRDATINSPINPFIYNFSQIINNIWQESSKNIHNCYNYSIFNCNRLHKLCKYYKLLPVCLKSKHNYVWQEHIELNAWIYSKFGDIELDNKFCTISNDTTIF